MITLKSRRELDAIKASGAIVRRVLDEIEGVVRPGMATLELDSLAADIIRRAGGVPAFKGYRAFPANICTSINEGVVHGIPSKRKLKEGDIISVDVGVRLNGYYADAAATFGVGNIDREARRLIDVTAEALEIGISRARAGNRLFDISSGIQEHVEGAGFSVVRAFVGHGIGSKMHEPPEVPNFGKPHTGIRLEAGMVLALEPMVNAGGHAVEVLDDGWTAVAKDLSLSAHFEDTIAVGEEAPEVLTR
jgi:methionyl aminopeptidase